MMTDFSPSKMVWAFLALSVNFITPFPALSRDFPQQTSEDEELLSSQSQRFWQTFDQSPEETTSQSSSLPLQVPVRMRSGGRFMTPQQQQDFEDRRHQSALHQVLRQELRSRGRGNLVAMVRAVEDAAFESAKHFLPDRLIEKLPQSLIRACEFKSNESHESAAKKITKLGLKILNAYLGLEETEKNNLAGLAFACAGYRSLKMTDVPLNIQWDFYLSTTQLFIWSAHRYQNPWVKRLMLNKASYSLGLALQTFNHIEDPTTQSIFLNKAVETRSDILKRHLALHEKN